jgi:TatD DNase family protein
MVFIDFHCHLDWSSLRDKKEEILNSMEKEDVIAFSNTLNYENYKETKELFEGEKRVFVCPGLYPQDAEKISDEELKEYFNLIRKNKESVKVIGEVGLDKHHTKDEELFKIQVRRFRQIIDLAIELDKPLCIHTRKAEKEVLDIIEEYINKTGFKKFNLHCFMGNKKLINKVKQLNIYCSIPVIVENTQSFQYLVETLSIRRLLGETDSPFLNPDKVINTPLNVKRVYKKIAEIKGYDNKEVENILYNNYLKLTM